MDVLRVKHILVVGHYGCGGVRAALRGEKHPGALGEWLRPLMALHERDNKLFSHWSSEDLRWDKLCELNVIEQARVATDTEVVRTAWAKGQDLSVHGWIYSIHDGLLRDLDITVNCAQDCDEAFQRALGAIASYPFSLRTAPYAAAKLSACN